MLVTYLLCLEYVENFFYRYVYYCMKYVNSLLSMGIKPVMVFDGCRLPSKEGVERQRREYVSMSHNM